MKITLELTYKQAKNLRNIMLTTYDRGSHDFPYQSDKMQELSRIICEAIDANIKDINDTHG